MSRVAGGRPGIAKPGRFVHTLRRPVVRRPADGAAGSEQGAGGPR